MNGGSASLKSRAAGVMSTYGLAIVALLLALVFAKFVDGFATLRNLQGLLLSVTLVGMVAVTMMLVLALGEVDLSVASTVALAGVTCATVITSSQNVWLGVAAGILAGGLVGVLNGAIVTYLRVNSLIATLAMMEIVRGTAFLASHGDAVTISEEGFFALGSGDFLGVSWPVWITLVAFLVFAVLLNRTVFGRQVLAIGGNAEAARLAGVPIERVRVIVFTLQGLMAGFAGVVLASRITSGQPNTSQGLELSVISACVLGGVSLTGGVATVLGTLVGVLLMGGVQDAMNLLNVPTFYQYIVRGGILLLAVSIDRLRLKAR
jgi:L-arabinose transport system permease protein